MVEERSWLYTANWRATDC